LVLTKELGEGYSVEKLVKSESGLKGRCEQISILKEKIRKLNEKLVLQNRDGSLAEITPKPQSSRSATDHNGLYKAELSKRKEFEKVQTEMVALKKQISDLRSKNEGLTARNKIVEDHKNQMNNQIKVLLKKVEEDDQYIMALREELGKQAEQVQSNKKVQKLQIQLAEQEQIIAGMRKQKEFQSASHSSASMRDGHADRLVDSLQLELQLVRESNKQTEAKLAQENSQNVHNSTYY
jgi:uncharacterized membrane protein YgaE (UPF0421/DUF939 family)